MAAFDELEVITDPDELGFQVDPASFAAGTEEILIFTATKTIALKVTGNLTKDGATIKAVYSKLKDAWRSNSTLIRFPFPMGPITDEQFEMINGWNWDQTNTSGETQSTVELLRTGGWSVVDTGGNVNELWTGVISLGTLGSTDQVYYQQLNSDEPSTNFKLTGKVNQAVRIYYYDGAGTRLDLEALTDSDNVDGYVYRRFFKMFVREWQKIYAQSEIFDIGVSQMTYQAYRFPLTNATDLKVTHTEVEIDANSDGVPDVGVYANVNITYLRNADDDRYVIRGPWADATAYTTVDVVRGSDNRWYKCILNHTSGASTAPITGGSYLTNWAAYEGERLIGAAYYAFDVIIDGDTTVAPTASGAARAAEIYEAVQYYLRQNTDIDADASASVTGKTANSLLRFVGDTLVTSNGVYIDSFNTQDTNAIEFFDYNGVSRTFPFVAALTVNFGTNLQNDEFAKYWVFFTNDDAGSNTGRDFGTTTAILVQDKDGVDMSGDVNPAWPTKRTSVSHSYNYDSNDQRGVGTYNSGVGTPTDSARTDAPVTIVGLGLSTGQYVSATGTIARSTANSVTLTASLERNYAQGTTYP
jgi:hypothetical protein